MTKYLFSLFLCFSLLVNANDMNEKYKASQDFVNSLNNKVLHGYITPQWIENTSTFFYQVTEESGEKYYLVSSDKKKKKEAFSLEILTEKLSKILDEKLEAKKSILHTIVINEDLKSFSFVSKGFHWTCELPKYKLTKGKAYVKKKQQDWTMARRDELSNPPVLSPDNKWKAYIKNYNLFIQNIENDSTFQLSYDGGLGFYYSSYLSWSPDSKKVMAYKITTEEKRWVHYVRSSPTDQLQPKDESLEYYKPGDALPQKYPNIFNVDTKTLVSNCDQLIPNQYSVSGITWRKNSKAITFEYNQRGHQTYQVIELSALANQSKILIDEQSETFITYSSKLFRYDVADGKEIIWMSERDGWNHLYLFDGETGKVKNQITKGQWVVRKVIKVNEETRTILFAASGKEEGDPYYMHYYTIDFDGNNMTHLTSGLGNHKVSFSTNYDYMVDTWSSVDMPPVSVLRNAKTGEKLMTLETANIDQLLATKWQMPEHFSAKGRDGKTDIYGIIIKPSHFDANKTYPVIEYIYAGPHDSFVPKDFHHSYGHNCQFIAELGFIVVQIDGMGTSNRSKAFHDVCWKNLKDAGLPDHIAWIKAAAAQRPYMNINKVGIYGMSAGAQSSTAALLFHPEFYKVAASACGCHDNRMDKIWWNEQWMGWPIGKEYITNSNTENANLLQGDLLLIVGEMDNNVDPSSTYQLVNALIKANKDFDFMLFPGLKHTWGGTYGLARIADFFVKKVMNTTPPERNSIAIEK